MRFDLENVKKCLTEKGKVFTVRSYCLENYTVSIEGIGKCRRIRGFEVKNKDQIKKFVKLSGFNNVNDWWKAIDAFCGDKRKWIYLVKKL
ncbi:MAG: hypothetical protein H8D26_09490 [Methanomicrobia archaeon]|nr:hypothetical protein [Methanomicrobia archaeon]